MKKFSIIILFFCAFVYCNAQHRFKTKNRDSTRYSEKSLDVKTFRTFNNLNSSFVHSLIDLTNESLVPVSIGAPIALYAYSEFNDNAYAQSSAVLLFLSELTNEAVTQTLKYTVRRNRPYRTLNNVYFTDTSSVKGTFSFPSGHSSGSFVIATSLTLRYPDNAALIAGLYTWATLVALGRMYWGVHYPSDVFTGMLVGAGSAALIYSLRAPIIKEKNKLFNQSDRTESHKTGIGTTAMLAAIIGTDLLSHFFLNSKNKLIKNSKINFSQSSKVNYLNYTLNF